MHFLRPARGDDDQPVSTTGVVGDGNICIRHFVHTIPLAPDLGSTVPLPSPVPSAARCVQEQGGLQRKRVRGNSGKAEPRETSLHVFL